jgi:ABC-type dipeptide/oligopeptide/nickel transport system permease subunit
LQPVNVAIHHHFIHSAGWLAGWLDKASMWLADAFLALPLVWWWFV